MIIALIGCQEFITGPLTSTLAKEDIAAIVDLKMVPYVSYAVNITNPCISKRYNLYNIILGKHKIC